MLRAFVPAVMAAVVALVFTTPAAAQEPAGSVSVMDFSAFGRRLTALEEENAALKLRVAALEGKKAATPAADRVAVGHTHTCPQCGTTWDHLANPTHTCRQCGTEQWVQDAFPRPVSARGSYSDATAASGCVGGACPTTQYTTTRTGLFRFLRR